MKIPTKENNWGMSCWPEETIAYKEIPSEMLVTDDGILKYCNNIQKSYSKFLKSTNLFEIESSQFLLKF